MPPKKFVPRFWPDMAALLRENLQLLAQVLDDAPLADENGDVEVTTPGAGLIVTSPDGNTRVRIRIDDLGNITTDTL